MENYHVNKTGKGWELIREGAERASKTASTKPEILKATRGMLEGKVASVKIHKTDGSIQEERTYPRKADPQQSRG